MAVDLAEPVITTCGSGVSAAILALAVEEAGGNVVASMTGPGRGGAATIAPSRPGPARGESLRRRRHSALRISQESIANGREPA